MEHNNNPTTPLLVFPPAFFFRLSAFQPAIAPLLLILLFGPLLFQLSSHGKQFLQVSTDAPFSIAWDIRYSGDWTILVIYYFCFHLLSFQLLAEFLICIFFFFFFLKFNMPWALFPSSQKLTEPSLTSPMVASSNDFKHIFPVSANLSSRHRKWFYA